MAGEIRIFFRKKKKLPFIDLQRAKMPVVFSKFECINFVKYKCL